MAIEADSMLTVETSTAIRFSRYQVGQLIRFLFLPESVKL